MRLRKQDFSRRINSDLKIEFAKQDLSGFSGLELFRRYFSLIELNSRIRRISRPRQTFLTADTDEHAPLCPKRGAMRLSHRNSSKILARKAPKSPKSNYSHGRAAGIQGGATSGLVQRPGLFRLSPIIAFKGNCRCCFIFYLKK